MKYIVTRIYDDTDQVFDSNKFDTLHEAVSEAEKSMFVPFVMRVIVEDDKGNVHHRTTTGGKG